MAKKDIGMLTGNPVTYQTPRPGGGVQMETFIPWTLVKRGVRRQVLTPLDAPGEFRIESVNEQRERGAVQHRPLLRALALAHYWQRLIDEGKYRTITEIAAIEGMDRGQASRIAQLVRLAPDIIEACMAGEESRVSLEKLIRHGIPMRWDEQRMTLLALRD